MNYKWVADKSHMSYTLLHMSFWVTNGSYMSHTLVILSNTTFLIFSKLTELRPHHNPATLQIWKINIIFNQLEKSNLVLSLLPFCDALQGRFFAHQEYFSYFTVYLTMCWNFPKTRSCNFRVSPKFLKDFHVHGYQNI